MADAQGPEKGLHRKFEVRRTDPEAQARHAHCWVFVLEPRHDPLARIALRAYADAAAAQGDYDLADDIVHKLNEETRRG